MATTDSAGSGDIVLPAGEVPDAVRQFQMLVHASESRLVGLGEDLEGLGRDADRASRRLEQSAGVVVRGFGTMAEAAIAGTGRMEQVVVRSFTSILQSLAAQTSPVLGAAVGVFGGILGSLFGGDDRRDRVQRVRLEEYGSRALDQRRERSDVPQVVSLVIVTPDGERLDELEYTLDRNTRRDAVVRMPRR